MWEFGSASRLAACGGQRIASIVSCFEWSASNGSEELTVNYPGNRHADHDGNRLEELSSHHSLLLGFQRQFSGAELGCKGSIAPVIVT